MDLLAVWNAVPSTELCRPLAIEPPQPQFGDFEYAGARPTPKGPAVFVRNTFLDVDDLPPKLPTLLRSHSTPPGFPASNSSLKRPEHCKEDRVVPRRVRDQASVNAVPRRRAQTLAGGEISELSIPDAFALAVSLSPQVQDGQRPCLFGQQERQCERGHVVEMGSQACMTPQERPLPSPSTPLAIRLRQRDSVVVELANAAGSPLAQTPSSIGSSDDGFNRVFWTVDGRKLRSNDKHAVSPLFSVSFGEEFPKASFKMMIYAKTACGKHEKGSARFKETRGRGFVQLKCEGEFREAVIFRIGLGAGEHMQPSRGPVTHNFSSSAVCGLARDEEVWDFTTAIEPESPMFAVRLEIKLARQQ